MPFTRTILVLPIVFLAGICSSPQGNLAWSWQKSNDNKSIKKSDGKKDKYLLRYRFRTHEVHHFAVEHTSDITMTLSGLTEKTHHEAKTKKHFLVKHVDAKGSALIVPVIDEVKMSVQFGNAEPKVYDSTSPTEPLKEFIGIAKTVGKELVEMRVSTTGKIESTKRLLDPKLQRRVTSGNGEALSDTDPAKNFLVEFPEKAMSVGEKWSDNSLKVPLQVQPGLKQEFTILRTFQLEKVKNGVAIISLRTTVTPPLRAPDLMVKLIQRLPEGTIYFDLEKGRIIQKDLKVNRQVVGLTRGAGSLRVESLRTERLLLQSTASKIGTIK